MGRPPKPPPLALIPVPDDTLPPWEKRTEGGKYCGALTRSDGPRGAKGKFCRRVAGHGTSHRGSDRCNLHGGNQDKLRTTGRYTVMKSTRMRDMVADFEKDPDPLNTLPELAAARALFVDYVDRYDEWHAALTAWHESWQNTRRPVPEKLIKAFATICDESERAMRDEGRKPTVAEAKNLESAREYIARLREADKVPRPRQIVDITAAMSHIDVISKIVERIEEARAKNAISRKDLTRLMDQMGRVVLRFVDNPVVLRQIRDNWLSLRL